jgi:aminopeptidase N
MKLLLPARCIAIFLSVFSFHFAEANPPRHGGPKPAARPLPVPLSTGYSGTGSNINVVYHRAEWTINPDASTKTITGTVTTYFKTISAGVTTISFDLNKTSFNNASLSVKYHGNTTGVVLSFPTSGNVNILNIKLPATLALNVLDSVSISYSGIPPAFGDYGEGYEKAYISATIGNVVYTLSESYGDDDWWPCKADMQDKIDSMDFIITTPSAFRAATNGVLTNDVVSGSNRIMTYKHRHPITTYLVAIGVAKYNVFNRTPVNINGTSVPIVYYIYSGRGANPTTQLTAMDFCREELVAFSNKFGDYPFKNEKYGMYEFGWGGGMEHQTFSAMGWSTMSSWSVIAHELAHQWFGNKVTFATWNHLWLAEGFAKYSEALAAELVPGLGQNPITHRSGIKSTALATSTTPIYLSNTNIANSNLIWTTANDNAIYQRGAMVVSMLRKLTGDTKFFQALKNYLADPALAYKSATTDGLRTHFETVLNYSLVPFFTDYIYGMGNPAYDVNWGASGSGINIELTTQRRSGTSVAYFRTPVVLRISNGLTGAAKKDTTVVIYDQNGQLSYAGNGISTPRPGKILGYNLSFTPASVTIDPDHETMVREKDGTAAATNQVAQSTVTKITRLNYPPTIVLLAVNVFDFKAQNSMGANHLSLLAAPVEEKVQITAERSEDGVAYMAIGEMIKASASDKGVLYNLEDKNILNAKTYYYRARITDEKGVVKYSKMISLKNSIEAAGSVSIRPNIVRDDLKIVLSDGWEREPVSITMFNSAGVAVKREKLNTGTSQQVQVRHLPAGNYSLEIMRPDGKTIHERFIIVR